MLVTVHNHALLVQVSKTYSILYIGLIILFLCFLSPPCLDYLTPLRIPPLQLGSDVSPHAIGNARALRLEIAVEGLDLGRGLLRAREEFGECFEGENGGEGRWCEEEGGEDCFFGWRHCLSGYQEWKELSED